MPEGGGRARRPTGCPRTVADARFAKPLDAELVERLAREHEVLITIEEGSIGGFGSLRACSTWRWQGLLDGGLKIRPMCLPDRFIDHDAPKKQYDEAGLNAPHIVATALAALGRRRDGAAGTGVASSPRKPGRRLRRLGFRCTCAGAQKRSEQRSARPPEAAGRID